MPAAAASTPTCACNSATVGAEFEHVAQDRETLARGCGQGLDRKRHRVRIGVVGVVEHGDAGDVGPGAAPGGEGRRRERGGRAHEIGAALAGDRECRGGVGGVPAPRARQDEPHAAHDQLLTSGVEGPRRFDAIRGRVCEPEAHHARRTASALRQHGEERIVGVQNRASLWAQGAENLRLGARHARRGSHLFEVRAADVGDHRQVRLQDARQEIQFAEAAHAAFGDEEVFVAAPREHGEWHADVVVEIAARRIDAAGSGERGRHQVLGRRLAVRTGDRNDARWNAHERACGQRLQRAQRIADTQSGLCTRWQRGQRIAAHEHAGGAARQDVGDELVGVETLAGERDEEFPGDFATRIRGHAVEHRLRRALLDLDRTVVGEIGQDVGAREFHRRPPAVSRCVNAWRATSRSSKWRVSLPMI